MSSLTGLLVSAIFLSLCVRVEPRIGVRLPNILREKDNIGELRSRNRRSLSELSFKVDVSGKIMCGDKPAADRTVLLLEAGNAQNPGYITQQLTDKDGAFSLSGSEPDFMVIAPYVLVVAKGEDIKKNSKCQLNRQGEILAEPKNRMVFKRSDLIIDLCTCVQKSEHPFIQSLLEQIKDMKQQVCNCDPAQEGATRKCDAYSPEDANDIDFSIFGFLKTIGQAKLYSEIEEVDRGEKNFACKKVKAYEKVILKAIEEVEKKPAEADVTTTVVTILPETSADATLAPVAEAPAAEAATS